LLAEYNPLPETPEKPAATAGPKSAPKPTRKLRAAKKVAAR
jgi:hypothetical protein